MPAFPQVSADPVAQVERYFGKYPGIVTNNDAPEDGPHLGQITVSIPGILEDSADGTSQQPIEVSALPCFAAGFFFVPEVDTRVWVEFAAGDVNQPIWTGLWYPRDAPPKTTEGAAPAREHKILRGATGQIIELQDSSDDPDAVRLRIQIETSDGDPDCVITLTNKGFIIETKDSSDKSLVLKVGSAATITLDDQGLQLDGKGSKLKLAQNSVELSTGATSIELDGTNITLKGSQVSVE